MKPLLLIIALLFSTPAWALEKGCRFSTIVEKRFPLKNKVTYPSIIEIEETIKKNNCEHIMIDELPTNFVTKLCRFDREIIYQKFGFDIHDEREKYICVPKK